MNTVHLIWGLILLIGLGWASPYALSTGMATEAQLWMAWAVVFLIGSWAMGKAMKKMPKDVGMTWMHATVFGVIVSFAVALGYVAAPLSALMALWFILWGAAMWKTAGSKDGVVHGVVLALVGVTLGSFGGNYWMTGAIFLGLMPIICTLLAKE
jgi:hypothetical protein